MDAYEIAYYAVRGTDRDPVKDVEEVKEMIEDYAKARAGQVDAIVTLLERRKKHWHDKSRESLVDNYHDELEEATHMYGVYIDVISDIRTQRNRKEG